MAEIGIRPATAHDVPSIRDLLAELFDAMDDPPATDPGRIAENCRALLDDPAHHMLVAIAADSVVGFVNFTTRRTISHAGPSGLIDELVVAAECQRQGIGKKLIAAAVQKCREIGCEEIEVATEKANTQARAFYRKCGFDEDAVLLEKDIVD